MKKCIVKSLFVKIFFICLIFSFCLIDNVSEANEIKSYTLKQNQSIAIDKGESIVVKLKTKKKTNWKIISGKQYIQLKKKTRNSIIIIAKKVGKAKVEAKIGNKKYRLSISIKNKSYKNDIERISDIAKKLVSEGADSRILYLNDKTIYEFDSYQNLLSIHWDMYLGTAKNVSVNGFNNLKTIRFYFNNVEKLDVANNVNLERIVCKNNKLSEIKLDNLKNLSILDCSNNVLSKLNLSDNIKLEDIDCSGNKLTYLDVSANTLLSSLTCSSNNLKTLDIAFKDNLHNVICSENKISELNLQGDRLLQFVDCRNNKIKDIKISENDDLLKLFCTNNIISMLDLSGAPKLEELRCENNKITTLDFWNNKFIKYLYYDKGVKVQNLSEYVCNSNNTI